MFPVIRLSTLALLLCWWFTCQPLSEYHRVIKSWQIAYFLSCQCCYHDRVQYDVLFFVSVSLPSHPVFIVSPEAAWCTSEVRKITGHVAVMLLSPNVLSFGVHSHAMRTTFFFFLPVIRAAYVSLMMSKLLFLCMHYMMKIFLTLIPVSILFSKPKCSVVHLVLFRHKVRSTGQY